MVKIIRIVGLALIGALSAVVYFVMAPNEGAMVLDAQEIEQSVNAVAAHQDGRSTAISAAILKQNTNETAADSAPQQQVVNGWATVDLLQLIADDEVTANESAALLGSIAARRVDNRIPALVALGVLAICWGFATQPTNHESAQEPSTALPPPLPPSLATPVQTET